MIKLVWDPKLEKKASDAERARSTLEIENHKLLDQLALSEKQVDENKKMYETLMIVVKQQEWGTDSDKEQKDYLLKTNRQLTSTVEHQENRCFKLECKVEKLKRYKSMVMGS